MNKRVLFLFQHSPYQSTLAQEGLDALLAYAAFDVAVTLILLDDAVWLALKDQNAKPINHKTLSKVLDVLPMYEVEQLFVCSDSLDQRGLNQQHINPRCDSLTQQDIQAHIEQHDIVLTF